MRTVLLPATAHLLAVPAIAGAQATHAPGHQATAPAAVRPTTIDAQLVANALRAAPPAVAKGASVAQIAIAWLLHQQAVTSVIIGAKRVDQLQDNVGAVEVTLSADQLAALDAVSKLPPEYPAWMIERQGGYRYQAPPPRG